MEKLPPELDETLDASEAPDGTGEAPPSVIDFGERFEVLERVGMGGMGVVYRAMDRELDELVALKSMLPKWLENRNAVTRFRREVKLARRITHENVARIHDLHVRDGGIFLTMEFIEGQALDERIAQEGRLETHDALALSRDICSALVAAHEAGVVHRDLKPANVLLTRDDRAIVTDFGIATASGAHEDGALVGTPHYIAPEQARGLAVDGRSDLYSFGVMLYEMLTGERPFEGSSATEVIMKRFLVDPPTLPERVATHRERRLIERLLALDPAERPPDARAALREMSATKPEIPTRDLPRARTNIALRTNDFVGRDDELEELRRRVEDEGQRLITILGSGGTGKTRLAEEFGRLVTGDFHGGVWFCNLRQTSTIEGIWRALAAGMGLEGADPRARVQQHLGGGPAILILDEVEGIAGEIRTPLTDLLSIDHVQIIVTSRLRLRHPAEFVFELNPLTKSDARELFCARARQFKGSFEVGDPDLVTIDAIVERVDFIPLAIELAAGRLGALTLEKLHARLSEQLRTLRNRGASEDRHSTLRATIEGSFEMLSIGAREALANLSVFSGGGPVYAANQVIREIADNHGAWPEDLVEELWDHSLIRLDSAGVHERFTMLSAIAEFAGEQLLASGDDEREIAERRHAEIFSEFAEERLGVASLRCRRETERELDNLESAIGSALRIGATRLAFFPLLLFSDACDRRGSFKRALDVGEACIAGQDPHLVAAAQWVCAAAHWRMGNPDSAHEAIRKGLRCVEDQRVHARLLLTRGNLHWTEGNHDEALRDYVEVGRKAAGVDADAEALAHGNRGLVHWNRGEYDLAMLRFREALEMHRAADAGARIGAVLSNMSNVATERGDLDEAIELMHQALEADRMSGDRRSEAIVLNNLGNVLRQKGRLAEAREHLERSLELSREHVNGRMIAISLSNLAVTYAEEDRQRSLRLFEEALELIRETNLRRFEGIALTWLGRFAREDSRFGDATAYLEQAEAILRDIEARAELAKLLCEWTILAARQGDLEGARSRFEEAAGIAADIEAGPGSELGQNLTEARAALTDAR